MKIQYKENAMIASIMIPCVSLAFGGLLMILTNEQTGEKLPVWIGLSVMSVGIFAATMWMSVVVARVAQMWCAWIKDEKAGQWWFARNVICFGARDQYDTGATAPTYSDRKRYPLPCRIGMISALPIVLWIVGKLLVIAGIAALAIGLSWSARGVLRIKKALARHKVDPQAHVSEDKPEDIF